LKFFRLFHSCGCQTVFVDGSFVSKKENPEDIDLCFDLTDIDVEKIRSVFPQFFEPNEIGRISSRRPERESERAGQIRYKKHP
jgi:hypothetical protein